MPLALISLLFFPTACLLLFSLGPYLSLVPSHGVLFAVILLPSSCHSSTSSVMLHSSVVLFSRHFFFWCAVTPTSSLCFLCHNVPCLSSLVCCHSSTSLVIMLRFFAILFSRHSVFSGVLSLFNFISHYASFLCRNLSCLSLMCCHSSTSQS